MKSNFINITKHMIVRKFPLQNKLTIVDKKYLHHKLNISHSLWFNKMINDKTDRDIFLL